MNIAAEKDCKLKSCVSIANPYNIEEVIKIVNNNYLINLIITCFIFNVRKHYR